MQILLLTNHSMILADLVRQTPIFNEIGGWIIDEAHQFIQAAIREMKNYSHIKTGNIYLDKLGYIPMKQLVL